MKFSAVIFDLDGTVIDTEDIWKQSLLQMLESRGIRFGPKFEQDLHQKVIGIGEREACSIIKKEAGINDPTDKLMVEQASIANNLYTQEVKFVAGFIEFHKKVMNLKLKNGLATNASPQILKLANNKLKLNKYFCNHMYCIADVDHIGKPDPTIYLHTAKKLNIKPQNCIAIEDSNCGIKAARKAGMFCIGLNTGKNRTLLKEADLIVEKYKEINLDSIFINGKTINRFQEVDE